MQKKYIIYLCSKESVARFKLVIHETHVILNFISQAVRQDKQTFGKSYSYDLFFPLQPIYLHEKFIKSVKTEYLREIIVSSKGRIASRLIGARFILTDSPSKIDANGIPIPEFNLNKEKIVYVRPEWIFDCVHKNSILSYRKYSVKDPELGTQLGTQTKNQ